MSFGVAWVPGPFKGSYNADEVGRRLTMAADRELYASKSAGRNCVTVAGGPVHWHLRSRPGPARPSDPGAPRLVRPANRGPLVRSAGQGAGRVPSPVAERPGVARSQGRKMRAMLSSRLASVRPAAKLPIDHTCLLADHRDRDRALGGSWRGEREEAVLTVVILVVDGRGSDAIAFRPEVHPVARVRHSPAYSQEVGAAYDAHRVRFGDGRALAHRHRRDAVSSARMNSNK